MTRRTGKTFKWVAMLAGVGGLTMFLLQSVQAKPEFSAQTQKPCATCHQNPAGGGKLKPYGEAFKQNGFKLPKGK